MGMLVQFGTVFRSGMQLLGGMFVLVFRCLRISMNVLVRVGVFVGVRMDRAVSVSVLVGMDVRVNVGVL